MRSAGPDGPCSAPVCVHCLLEQHSELRRGLKVAIEHRGARRVADVWVAAAELWDA